MVLPRVAQLESLQQTTQSLQQKISILLRFEIEVSYRRKYQSMIGSIETPTFRTPKEP